MPETEPPDAAAFAGEPTPLLRELLDTLYETDACEICGAGPTGRCNPPDDYLGTCPYGCSPER